MTILQLILSRHSICRTVKGYMIITVEAFSPLIRKKVELIEVIDRFNIQRTIFTIFNQINRNCIKLVLDHSESSPYKRAHYFH